MAIGIGLLGLGTVGAGVAEILLKPQGRHPLVAELELRQVAVRSLELQRSINLPAELLCSDPAMPAGCPADFNRDGNVDNEDFIIFAEAYNTLLCP